MTFFQIKISKINLIFFGNINKVAETIILLKSHKN